MRARADGARRSAVRLYRLLSLLLLVATLIAPFGRAEAGGAVHDAPAMAMAGHCDPMPASDPSPAHQGSIDCMIACAGMLVGAADINRPTLPTVSEARALAVAALHGILPQFDPPPPRFAS